MFNLTLNIDYVIAALIILVALYIFSKKKFFSVNNANKIFYYMLLCAIFTSIMDILMNIAITYSNLFPDIIYMFFRLLFNCGTSSISYLAYLYSRNYQGDKSTKTLKIIDSFTIFIFISYIVLSVLNMSTGIIAYLDEQGVYKHGPLFLLNTIVPLIIFLSVIIVQIIYKEDYTPLQSRSIILYYLITFSFVIIELLTNNVAPLTMFGISISLIVLQQSLLTPEYVELEEALKKQQIISNEAKEAKLEAERANNAKSEFLARMSHEIRTPLNALIGFNSAINKEANTDNVKSYSEKAKIAGENLLGLVNDILDFSKIENGKLSLIEDEYQFDKLIKEEYFLFLTRAENKGLKLIFKIDENIPSKLYGDSLRIKQILSNIISNAVKYTEKGSITLTTSLKEIKDDIAVIEYHVSDTGMGIKKEDLNKLFNAFERIDEKKNHKIEGTGLGVNICSSLLSLMDSKLNVSSEYKKGSDFYFVLNQKIIDKEPIGIFDPNDNKNENTSNDISTFTAPDAKILVVDDTPLNVEVLKILLSDLLINVDSADNGKSALKITKENKYDLILMDHYMPEMDGVETMREIKSDKNNINKDTPIAILTANAMNGAKEEYLEAGFDAFLSKPIDPINLFKAVKELINSDLIK